MLWDKGGQSTGGVQLIRVPEVGRGREAKSEQRLGGESWPCCYMWGTAFQAEGWRPGQVAGAAGMQGESRGHGGGPVGKSPRARA